MSSMGRIARPDAYRRVPYLPESGATNDHLNRNGHGSIAAADLRTGDRVPKINAPALDCHAKKLIKSPR